MNINEVLNEYQWNRISLHYKTARIDKSLESQTVHRSDACDDSEIVVQCILLIMVSKCKEKWKKMGANGSVK